jgi:hypothetical protein
MMQGKPYFIVVAPGNAVTYPAPVPELPWTPPELCLLPGEPPALWRVVEIDLQNGGCIIERSVPREERDAFGFSRGSRVEQRWVFLDELAPLVLTGKDWSR